ncbi:MAG: hypothetical protein ACI4EH_13210 [Oliverpabstia sp.]
MKLAEIINTIQELIDKINDKTGKSDTTLSEAVDRVTSGNMVDTSDGTAVSGDLKYGKTAFVNGKKVTGTLQKATQVLSRSYADDKGVSVGRTQGTDGITRLSLSYYTKSERYFEKGTYVSTVADFENFGDALEDDVVSGKTFTSAAGLKKIGTAEMFKKKSGTVEIAGDTGSFTIDTGLTTIDSIVVYKTPENESTFFWVYSEAVKARAYKDTSNQLFSVTSSLNDSTGKITCSRHSSMYPIKAGTYKWVAYGS